MHSKRSSKNCLTLNINHIAQAVSFLKLPTCTSFKAENKNELKKNFPPTSRKDQPCCQWHHPGCHVSQEPEISNQGSGKSDIYQAERLWRPDTKAEKWKERVWLPDWLKTNTNARSDKCSKNTICIWHVPVLHFENFTSLSQLPSITRTPKATVSPRRRKSNRPTHRDGGLLALFPGRWRRSWALAGEERCSIKTGALHGRQDRSARTHKNTAVFPGWCG